MGKDLFKKIYLWGPALVQMALIFYFSSQPSGSESLERFPLPAGLGHFCGYALLGFLLYRALSGGLKEWNLRAAGGALIIAVVYGAFDEFYQGFVPGRHSSLSDVAIDGAGAMTAICLFWVWVKVRDSLRMGKRGQSRDVGE